MTKDTKLYTCAACGYKTLEEDTRASYEICRLCGWEDDNVQNEDPNYEGGANEQSLRQRQQIFAKEHPERPDQLSGYLKDSDWQLLI